MIGPADKYFCGARYNIIEYAPGKIGIMTPNGIRDFDVQSYKDHGGYHDFVPPKWSDLKAGRVRPQDVGPCLKDIPPV